MDTKATGLSAIEIIKARNEADRRAAASILAAEKAVAREAQTDDAGIPVEPAARRMYLLLEQTRLDLLYELCCCNELCWYETNSSAADAALPAADICKPLRNLIYELEFLRDSFFRVGEHSVPHFLYTTVPHERLTFVLLHQILLGFSEDMTFNTVEFFAKKENGEVRLDLVLSRDADYQNEALPAPPRPVLRNEALPYSGEALTKRFCAKFGVRLFRRAEADRICTTLSIPAADTLAQHTAVHSVGISGAESGFSAYEAVLSCLLPPESIVWSRFRDG